MLRGQRGGATKTDRGVLQHHLPFSAVSVRVFRPEPADPNRASGEGKDGSDLPFSPLARLGEWGSATPGATPGATPPLAKRGSLPSEIILAGRLRRPPTGTSGRADGRRDDAARRRVFADRRRHVLVLRRARRRRFYHGAGGDCRLLHLVRQKGRQAAAPRAGRFRLKTTRPHSWYRQDEKRPPARARRRCRLPSRPSADADARTGPSGRTQLRPCSGPPAPAPPR